MEVIIKNTYWMSFNMALAVIPVILGFLLFFTKNKISRLFIGLLWLLFLPNTIYIILDLFHLFETWYEVTGALRIVLLLQYLVLLLVGLVTYFYSLYPVELVWHKKVRKKKQLFIELVILNFLIGFALVLGNIERVNSWDALMNMQFVISSSIEILTTFPLLILAVCYGILSNLVYFTIKKPMIKYFPFDK